MVVTMERNGETEILMVATTEDRDVDGCNNGEEEILMADGEETRVPKENP